MSWSWRCEKADGSPATGRSIPKDEFGSQSDAETWLGERWRDLLEVGVDQVVLFSGDKLVYGPMSLHPEDVG